MSLIKVCSKQTESGVYTDQYINTKYICSIVHQHSNTNSRVTVHMVDGGSVVIDTNHYAKLQKAFDGDTLCPLTNEACRRDCSWSRIITEVDDNGFRDETICAMAYVSAYCMIEMQGDAQSVYFDEGDDPELGSNGGTNEGD